jgi:hypothetical protein
MARAVSRNLQWNSRVSSGAFVGKAPVRKMKTPIDMAWPPSALPEAPASPRASASCYRNSKHIFVIPVVVDERPLGNVQREISAADVVVDTDDTTLQNTPEAFNRVRVDCANNILAGSVPDDLMREEVVKQPITGVLVRREQADFRRDGFTDEAIIGPSVGRGDHAGHYVPLAAYGADDGRLARAGSPTHTVALVPMPVLGLATDKRLVHFNDTHELLELFVLERGANAVAHIPSGFVAPETHDTVNLTGADALLGSQHHVDNPKPLAQIDVGVLENRADEVREAICATLAALRAFPLKFHCLERVDLLRAATRAIDAIRPALGYKVRIASSLVRERRFPLGDAHLHDLTGLLCAGHDGNPSRQEGRYHV